jgi:uncharacterized membrane protein YebE (DUF533 family)
MFDARSLLEALVKGAAPQPAQQPAGGLGGLGDILGQMMNQGGKGGAGGANPLEGMLRNMLPGSGGQAPQGGAPQAGGGGLEDLLRQMLPGGGQGAGPGAQAPGGGGMGGLGDILGQLQKQMGQGGAPASHPGAGHPGAGQGGGGLMDILGQVLGQATQGVKEGAGRIEDATGIGRGARDAIGQATGHSPDDLMRQLQDLVANNKLGTGAALGGLGALVLGTKTGRSAAATAAKLGALALIGGLAYKAYQNYAEGRPMVGGNFMPEAAPHGSGFEPSAVTNETAALYIRAMIGAAAADGRIDAAEQQKIIGSLKQAGVDSAAEEFLAQELNSPASPQDLVGAVQSPEQAVQVYTAARIAIEPDTHGEQRFLAELAQGLGIDRNLAAHVDAAARSAAA